MSGLQSLLRRRQYVRERLRNLSILPPVGVTMNEEQQSIYDQIGNDDFSYWNSIKKNKGKEFNPIDINVGPKFKRIHKESERPVLKKARITYELRDAGILPPLNSPMNEEHERIIKFINENYETPIKSFITSFSDNVSPENRMWYKTKKTASKGKNKKDFNLSVEDIIIPTHCPYLGIELTTVFNENDNDNYYSIDRIDSNYGYVKGNIQIISKLANTMKNKASKEQMITFALNILKMYNIEIPS